MWFPPPPSSFCVSVLALAILLRWLYEHSITVILFVEWAESHFILNSLECTGDFTFLGLQGLLQSEVEGDYDESIGFYGRCLLHAMNHHHFKPESYRLDIGDADDGQKKSTCARTEVCCLDDN